MRISRAVNAFGVLAMVSVLAAVATSFYAVRELRVGGPLYAQVVLGKDLVADILPPPEYVIEAYLETRLAIDDPSGLADARAKLAQLHKDYDDRRAYWRASPLVPDLRDELIKTSDISVQAFWREVEQVYLPALDHGDQVAAHASLARIGQAYEAHRKVIDDIVTRSNAMNARLETQAAHENSLLLAVMTVAAVLAAGAVGAGVLLVRKAVVAPIGRMTSVMGRLAEGDYEIETPMKGRADEIGEMARAVEVFRASGQERQQLREQQEAARQSADSEREQGLAARETADRERVRVVEELARGLERMSQGDLSFRLAQAFPAEYEKLRSDFNAAIEALAETLGSIVEATGGVQSGADEIAAAADNLSARTARQTSALQEGVSALGQINSALNETVGAAERARKAVGDTKGAAESSAQVVGEAVEAMDKIEQSSRQIGQIIGVIDEIAFQTNLLALNAGVEAARAGEAGKGFAVVASEVRALAQRSAEAAKEIKQLVQRSGEDVSTGVGLVAQTGEALRTITGQVGEISALVQEMSGAAKAQSTSLDQASGAVRQVEQATRENGGVVEQATLASHALAGEAEKLGALVQRFRITPAGSPVHELNERVRRELALG